MNGEDVKPPAFCPACGAKLRHSLAERLGIGSVDLGNIIMAAVVLFLAAIMMAVVAYGLVMGYKNRDEHEAEMMRGGFVQQTRIIVPGTTLAKPVTATEWVKEPQKKEEK